MIFFQNCTKPNPEKYQALVLGRTEDKVHLKSGDIDIRTTEKTNLLGVVLDSKLKFDDRVSCTCRKVKDLRFKGHACMITISYMMNTPK